jgi:DNA-binding transcriptional LysR family regulator
MEIIQLQTLVVLAEELHFGRAAERLFISQPALTKQIQKMEEELGFTVFERTRRSVELTPAGAVLLNHVQAALTEIERGVTVASQIARGEQGVLRVGFNDLVLNSFFPSAVRLFRETYPDVQLVLSEQNIGAQQQAVLNGQLDIGLVYLPIEVEGLKVERVHCEGSVLAIPPQHPLAEQTDIQPADLDGKPFILHPRHLNPPLYQEMMASFARTGFQPSVVQEAISKQTILGLVAAGLGVAILPASIQRSRTEDVVFRHLPWLVLDLEHCIIWREDHQSALQKNFLELVQQAVQEM